MEIEILRVFHSTIMENERKLKAQKKEQETPPPIESKITDGPTQVTYNKFTPTYTKVLDYIFYKNAVGLEYHVVNSKDYGTDFISDHYPVYCDMAF